MATLGFCLVKENVVLMALNKFYAFISSISSKIQLPKQLLRYGLSKVDTGQFDFNFV